MKDTIVLRFRDLIVPDGETIRRHSEIAEQLGYVWWGWMMRQRELKCPACEGKAAKLEANCTACENTGRRSLSVLSELVNRCDAGEVIKILLFDSGTEEFWVATLMDISALPRGEKDTPPELAHTPAYMHETHCPAWFKLCEFDRYSFPTESALYKSFPTLLLSDLMQYESEGTTISRPSDLSGSKATLWHISFC